MLGLIVLVVMVRWCFLSKFFNRVMVFLRCSCFGLGACVWFYGAIIVGVLGCFVGDIGGVFGVMGDFVDG